jgi:predicted dehydrogenase
MIKVGLIGAGKMGISHLAILGANPNVELVGVCDTSKIVIEALQKYSPFPCFTDYGKMLNEAKPDAVVIAVPTKFHAKMVKEMLNLGIHVFVEKPFCLNAQEGQELINLAESKGLVNQVGYHNKFVGTFQTMKRMLKDNIIGDLYHFHGQAYGPVVVKAKQDTWRSNPEDGGGCLMDYASHVIDLINDLLAPVSSVPASFLKPVFSNKVDDAVFAMMGLSNGLTGMLSVNWSDDTHRKMTTSVTVNGKSGKIIADANELKIFVKDKIPAYNLTKGWNIKYVTDLTEQVDYYLRGEEYSLQMNHFVACVDGKANNTINNFRSAYNTDKAIELIRKSTI